MCAKSIQICYIGQFFDGFIKKTHFSEKELIFQVNPSFGKRQSQQMDEFFLENFFRPSVKVAYFQKFLKQKWCWIFYLMHFRLWSAPFGGCTKTQSLNSLFFLAWFPKFWSRILKISSFVLSEAIQCISIFSRGVYSYLTNLNSDSDM